MDTHTKDESSSSQFQGSSNKYGSTNNNNGNNKIISIESTADGDITTIEERTMTTTNVSPGARIASDSIAAFKNHLRDSWDEEGLDLLNNDDDHSNNNYIDGLVDHNERSSSQHHLHHHRSRHRQNLSVQFLEFSISGDDVVYENDNAEANTSTTTTTTTTTAYQRRLGKETIEGSASYYFDPSSSSSTSRNNDARYLTSTEGMVMMEENNNNSSSSSSNCNNSKDTGFVTSNIDNGNNDTKVVSKFTNALQDSWNLPPGNKQRDRNSAQFIDDDTQPTCFNVVGKEKEQEQQQQQQQQHQQSLSYQERKDASLKLECNNKEAITTATNCHSTLTSPADAVHPSASANAASTSATANNAMPCENQQPLLPQLPSHDHGSTPQHNAIDVDHHRLPDMIQPLRLGSDSPISPSHSTASYSSEITDIVAPIPFRPSGSSSSVGGGSSGSGGGNRKHRRVFSGKSNPALVHRRVNTRGDKCAPPGEDVFQAETNEPIERQQYYHHHQQQQQPQQEYQPQNDKTLSPSTEVMPTYTFPQERPHIHQPPPLYQPQAQYPPQYEHGTHLMHNTYPHHLPPQMPYHNHGTQTPPTYYSASPTPDTGVNYSAHHTSSPVVSGYPTSQEHPPQQASQYQHQYPTHQSSSPSGYPPPGQVQQQLPPFHNQYPAHQPSPEVSGYPPPPAQSPQQASMYPKPGHQTPPLILNYPPSQGQQSQHASPYHSQHSAHQTSPVVSSYPPPPTPPAQQAPVYYNHQYPAHQTSPIVSGYPPSHEQSPSSHHSQYPSHHASPIVSGYPQMQEQSPQQAAPSHPYPAHQTSPTVSGYPPPKAQPSLHAPSHHNQYPAHQSSIMVAGYPPPQQTSYMAHRTIQPPPPILTQPSLEEQQSLSRSNSRNREDLISSEVDGCEQDHQSELLHNPFPNNEKGRLRVKASPKGHRKEPSFNPLPFIDTNDRNSLGSFLATTTLFDDDLSDKGEDYTSAAEEGDAVRHSRNNSLNSLAISRLEQFVDKQSKELDTTTSGLPHPHRPPPPPPVIIPTTSDGYPMLSTSPVVSHVMARQSPTGSLSDYSHPPLHPPPPPLQHPNASDGYHSAHSTSPVISSSMAYQPCQLGSTPGHPPTPPSYHPPTPPPYPHSATPPQSSWHPPHQQQSPTYHNMHHQSPQHQIMEYHQTPPYHHPQPYHGIQHHTMSPYSNAPPPPCGAYTHGYHSQQPLCPPTAKSTGESSQSSGGSTKEPKSRRKCSIPDCPNRVVQGGLCIAHGAKRKTCSVEGCTKNVKKLGLCSTHGPARKRCEYEGCTKVAVKSGRCIAHGAKKKGCSHNECEKQAIFGGMCKRHYDETNRTVKGLAPVTKNASEDDNVIGDEDNDDISSDEQADPNDVSIHQAPQTGDEARGHHHHRGLSLFHESELMNTIINNGVPPVENDGLHGLSILYKDDTGDPEATSSNLKD